MITKYKDYNDAGSIINNFYLQEWKEIENCITEMPLHIKGSEQRGIVGRPIFDPVGTNQFIKDFLTDLGWHPNIPIPKQYSFLGTDIDFGKSGLLVEVQFSNYPFLLNNTVRSELFFKSGLLIDNKPVKLAIIITKARMFPASNSTLYYEQAENQLNELIKNKVFDIPIRLVGLFENEGDSVIVKNTVYQNRYSRDIANSQLVSSSIQVKRTGSRAEIKINDK